MQLKISRSQRDTGVFSNTVVFCLDARAEYTPQEFDCLRRYKLHNQVIYSSEAQKRAAQGASSRWAEQKAQRIGVGSVDQFLESSAGKIGHGLKAVALGVVSAMRLTITVASLSKGQHIECKSMEELLAAEDALITACQNLKSYLDAAATFDGREVLLDFTGNEPQIVAQTDPGVVAPGPPRHIEAPVPELAYAPSSDGDYHDQSYTSYGGAFASGGANPFEGLKQFWHGLTPQKQAVLVAVAAILFTLLLLKSCS
jgi:hypothetical protein